MLFGSLVLPPLLDHLFNIEPAIRSPILSLILHILEFGDQHQLVLVRFLQVEGLLAVRDQFPFGLLPFLEDAVLEIGLFLAAGDRVLTVEGATDRRDFAGISLGFEGIFQRLALGFLDVFDEGVGFLELVLVEGAEGAVEAGVDGFGADRLEYLS